MKKGVMILSWLIIVVLILAGTYYLMNAREIQLFGGITSHVDTDEKVVALTFDDGPTDKTGEILELLDTYDATATFFLIGKEMEEHPEEVAQIIEAGHGIGNHSYSHKRMIFKSPSFIEKEIRRTDALIRKAGYDGEIDFRPPNGKKLVMLPYYLYKHDKDTIMWNLEPDSEFTSVEDKVRYVADHVEGGSIILMHPMYDGSGKEMKAVEGILKELSSKGYTFVTVKELKEYEQD
ncbi:polysaccharide deacetylase family protein [Rossellomorea aquimaris]|uniref:polysaccharide deacetylase family protein n=1 Tax=Rossellomorea aquimaris TaxID=189382 RepID=UPI001CD77C65|nr:polysaccharide deacetylase family protein [Rossellomorea aquimaris]MCA1055966.1 polysaccharide deacetylase family protein [Rossellomorea aquimaris]